ncbi:MAG: potassium-transporting ATPase subunit C [Thaumarchaeota archaeon]|nr:potassium-transporting ATPase subunit C [Nitrososphaerota archaeon]MCS4540515.1 potassium-transporting ATPase subunit C [Nitrososphaerota archaeon]
MKTGEKGDPSYRSALGLAIISLLMCGLFFPLLITGIAQALLPYQANGEIVQLNGRDVGSILIAQNVSSPVFFHPRNDSASGVDPDITLQDAYSQIPRIHNATGISSDALVGIINQNVEGTLWIFGSPYVNVLRLNLLLATTYPSVYKAVQ